ncbi:hypothetical protein LTR53_017820, partial [Teratosphaeriaceae sp. CCFEE 6253]
VIQPLDMRDPALPARIVRLEVQLPLRRRRDGLDAEDLAPLVREPVHGFERQAREIVLPAGVVKGDARVEGHVQQHCIPRADLLARGRERGLHLTDGDAGPERHVREVEAEGRGVEVRQRHAVDGEPAGAEVLGRVDVRARVVAQGEEVGGGAEGRGAGALGLVGVPGGHDDGGVEGVRGAAVVELPAEVDELGFAWGGGGGGGGGGEGPCRGNGIGS